MEFIDISDTIKLFKKYYPGLDPYDLDQDLLTDMISEILLNEQNSSNNNLNNSNNNIIEKNYFKAKELTPFMLNNYKTINLKGKFQGLNIDILFDTGCARSITYKSIIDQVKLDYLIDKQNIFIAPSVNGVVKNYGTIWYTELEIEITTNNYVKFPIKLDIMDDLEKNNYNNLNKKIILGIDFMRANNVIFDVNQKTISINNLIIINY